jgi:Fe-S cluster biogenesis protein NfuA
MDNRHEVLVPRSYNTAMSTLQQRVEQAIRQHAAPAMGLNGEEIDVVAVDDGIASLRLSGACASCPASITVLIMGLEQELKKHVPEVEMIEAVL